MTTLASRFPCGRKLLAATVAAASFGFFSDVPALAGSMATIRSAIYDPTGQPAPGYTVVMRDVASGPDFASRPTDRSGEYAIEVPAGARYRVVSIISPAGERIPVRPSSAVSVRAGGEQRMNVHLRLEADPGRSANRSTAQIAPGASASGVSTSAKVIAVVIVAAAIAVFSFSDDNPEQAASASVPF